MDAGVNRKDLLKRLVEYRLPIEPVLEGLSHFPFYSEDELVCIQRADVVAILDRFLGGRLTAEQVTDWADQVEVREDLGLDENCRDALRDVIFSLANPNLREPITPEVARALRASLIAGE
jgi:hypothetical protein